MPRIKLTEYRAKKLLLGESYRGVSIRADEPFKIPKSGQFVAKVDQGIKKRMKKGLVLLDQSPLEVDHAVSKWKKKGFSQFLIEPFLRHKRENEQYISLERIREGIRLMHAGKGGIDIESRPETVKTYILQNDSDINPAPFHKKSRTDEKIIAKTDGDITERCGIKTAAQKTKLPEIFINRLLDVFENNFFAFLEINPLVVAKGKPYPLDAAVLVDSAGTFFVKGAWTENDIVSKKHTNMAEKKIDDLAKTSPASFKLTVLNPNGSLFFLLSGGGGSIVIADEAELRGVGKEVGNYGEYSGGPTREETYLYSKEVIKLLLKSKAKRKALILAGGVANFTDVKQTFLGIIDSLSENGDQLRKNGVKVFVRRGGPNEKEGLELMRTFLKKEKILGTVYGSDSVITKAIDDAIKFVRK